MRKGPKRRRDVDMATVTEGQMGEVGCGRGTDLSGISSG